MASSDSKTPPGELEFSVASIYLPLIQDHCDLMSNVLHVNSTLVHEENNIATIRLSHSTPLSDSGVQLQRAKVTSSYITFHIHKLFRERETFFER